MSHLLIKDTFDSFLLSQADITTANSYSIDGRINASYFSSEEYEALEQKTFTDWASIKPICFQLIKGNKVPTAMKIVFLLSPTACEQLLKEHETGMTVDNINGLFINIRYTEGAVTIITGTSLNMFTLDKTIDTVFDQYVQTFLSKASIDYEVL
jgi:hypothetical protein